MFCWWPKYSGKVGRGKKGRWRWSIYRGDQCVAVSPISGYATRGKAVLEAQTIIRGRIKWES